MITNRYINLLIVGFVVFAVVFTGIFMFRPETLGIQALSANPAYAEKLFNQDAINTIQISADQSEWDQMLENATDEEYISCDLTINGETYYSVGIRAKGNSSLSMVANDETTNRFSFKIKMDEFVKGQNYYGLSKFVINNMMSDSTYMKEYLSYDMFAYLGVATPLYAYADISVNNEAWGFYLAVEAMEEEFAQRSFGVDHGELYKPESVGMGGGAQPGNVRPEFTSEGAMAFNGEGPEGMPEGMPAGRPEGMPEGRPEKMPEGMPAGRPGDFAGSGGGSDLVYTDGLLESYSQIFEQSVFKTTESDHKRVLQALKALSEGEELEDYINVDEVLRYFAVNTALVNLDSYVSSMKHNYYLYEHNGQLSILPWDLNLAFAGFQSGTAKAAVNFPIDTPVSGVSLSERPLIGVLLEQQEYCEKYHSYIKNLIDGYFKSGRFEETIDKLDAMISDYVKNDSTAFYTYEQYVKGVETLKEFGRLRAESMEGQLNGSVPATQEGQNADPDSLVDSGELNLSDMGAQGGGRSENKERPAENSGENPFRE